MQQILYPHTLNPNLSTTFWMCKALWIAIIPSFAYFVAIITAAMEMLGGGGDIAKQCRIPEIMADAAYIMLTRDARNFTGNFIIDEDILKEEGCKDMEQVSIQ